MSDHSDVTSTASQIPARRRVPQIVISSSSSSPSPSPPSSSSSNPYFPIPDLLEPIAIMSSPSAHSPSARDVEEAAELDAYMEQRAASVPSPQSPHDSPDGAQ